MPTHDRLDCDFSGLTVKTSTHLHERRGDDLVQQPIIISPEGLREDGCFRPADELFKNFVSGLHDQFLAEGRKCQLTLGKSSKEWVVFTLFGLVIARVRVVDRRYIIEATEAVQIDRQSIAA